MLYIVATPIGNLEDITLRALRVLKEVDFILAEDTRKTGILLKQWGINKKMVSFYEHNETVRIPRIIEELRKNKHIALISNAGTPTISDPGYKLIRECRKESLPLTSLPGPSSLINILALTSLAHDKFTFLGYLPRKKNERKKLLEKWKSHQYSLVFFESPFRLLASLQDIKEILGNRRITIAREMTKKFETVYESCLEEVLLFFRNHRLKGEFTLVLASGKSQEKNSFDKRTGSNIVYS